MPQKAKFSLAMTKRSDFFVATGAFQGKKTFFTHSNPPPFLVLFYSSFQNKFCTQ